MLALHIAPTPFFADRGCHIRIRNEIEALRDSGVRVILCTYPLGADQEGIDIRRYGAQSHQAAFDQGTAFGIEGRGRIIHGDRLWHGVARHMRSKIDVGAT